MKTLIAGALAAALLAGCAQMSMQPSGSTEELIVATATVEAVDRETRTVQLRDEADGEVFVVTAGEQVRNFDQIEAGDRVEIDYYESIALDMAAPEDTGEPMTAVVTGRAPEGSLPAGIAATTTSLVVRLNSYDSNSALATFTTPDGIIRRAQVPPELRNFVSQRSRGDRILVTLTEAVAVGITETG